MKKHIHLTGIWLLVALLALMVACDPKEKVVEPMEKPLPELATIDSLMWRQPDSAFAVLRQFVASSEAESLDAFNGHYIQMLISELLYKKDYEQSNREALLDAVVYFDSLMANSRSLSQQERNVFLDARVHYINGVGFYEQGDVVQACSEYLNVLEIMKGNFQDQALTGIRAKFMFYTYNRLLELFSAQFMMASAIKCGEEALAYCQKEPSLSKEIPNTYFHIGKQYDKMGKKNNARDYYGRAIEGLSDINSLVYRDAVSMKAFCDYQVGHEVDSSLSLIRKMLAHANNEKERLTRLLVIGGIFTIEQSFDSALYYLKPVFENKDVVSFQIQAAEYLLINYNNLGNKEKADECIRFLGDNKKPDGEDKALVSKLEDLFKVYIDQKQEKEAEEAREKSIRKTIEIIVPIAIMIALTIFIVVKLRSKTLLKQQQEEADRKLGETEQEHEKEMRLWQAEADKTLEETKKKYEEELRQLQADTEQQLEEVERKHQQWMAKTKERHEEELKAQKEQSDKEIEKTKRRHEEELEAERLAYQAEMAEKEAKTQTERKLHEETLKRHQVETEQRMSEAERKHQQKLEEIARKHEMEMQTQEDNTKKEAEQTHKRHEAELEAERLAYQKEQEALRQHLQQREAQVSALEKVLEQQSEVATKRRAAFLDEEICQRILDLLHGKHITSRDTSFQHGIGLKEEDFKLLKDAVERHYKGFDNMLLSRCPSLKQSDLTLCHLHLLGLNEGEIGALKDRTYSAIKKQNENLQEKMGVEESLSAYVLKVAEGLCGPKNVNQKEEENMPLPQIMDGFEGQTEGISQESTLKSTLKDTLKGTQKTIVEIVISNPNVTIPEVARQLNLNPRGIAKHFKVLQDKGVIRRVGPDKGGHWEVIE